MHWILATAPAGLAFSISDKSAGESRSGKTFGWIWQMAKSNDTNLE